VLEPDRGVAERCDDPLDLLRRLLLPGRVVVDDPEGGVFAIVQRGVARERRP